MGKVDPIKLILQFNRQGQDSQVYQVILQGGQGLLGIGIQNPQADIGVFPAELLQYR